MKDHGHYIVALYMQLTDYDLFETYREAKRLQLSTDFLLQLETAMRLRNVRMTAAV